MFSLVEFLKEPYFNGVTATCLTHTESREQAEKELTIAKLLPYTQNVDESYDYKIIEFKYRCPECGRNYTF